MTDFTLNNGLTQTAWSTDYLKSYVRKSGFASDMKANNAPILVKKDLTKKKGDAIRVPYFGNLTGDGVTGASRLKGNEEALANYTVEVRAETKRHGILLHENDMFKTDLQLANIAREGLVDWHANDLRSDIIREMYAVPVAVAGSPDATVAYGDATAGNRNAYNAANSDRLVFGTSTSTPSGTHATDLSGIAASETLSAAVLDYAKDRAESTVTMKINPYSTEDGREYFILYTGTAGYNQLRQDDDIKAAMQYAWTRDEMKNPLFRGGDLLWNGVIVRKIPEIGSIGGVGTSSATVTGSFLCGNNAVAVAYAAMPEARKDVDDYGEEQGVAIRDVRGVKKITAGLKDVGMVTIYHAA